MEQHARNTATTELFETKPVLAALTKMAIPTIISQLITLIYNVADTWFIGQTDNPYMVAASSLVLTFYFMTIALANVFGVGGGSLTVRLLGSRNEDEARKVASLTLTMATGAVLVFSLVCLSFMDPLLRLLGASDNTIEYARQYLFFVVVLGGLPTVLSSVMSSIVRNLGCARQAALGLGLGGVLNVLLDPLFMFVLLPDGYEVVGAALATMLSNYIALGYFILTYRRLRGKTVLQLPRRIEKVQRSSLKSLFAVGLPAGLSLLLFDITNIFINRLAASHGDIALAAMGIVLKVERLPLNTCIGICLGMTPLVAYNYAANNKARMHAFFTTARKVGLVVCSCSVVLYYLFAPWIIPTFISDRQTVELGSQFLQVRCFAAPFMFLSFHMVHFMQAIGRGKISFWMAVIRQLFLNIPILLLMNHLFGVIGVVWTQMTADILNCVVSYLIYGRLRRELSI